MRGGKTWEKKNQVSSSRISCVQEFTGIFSDECRFRMEQSCFQSVLLFVINLYALFTPRNQKLRFEGGSSTSAVLFVLFFFSPDTALKVLHQFPSAGTILEVLYHSRLPRGQQSSTSWLSWLYSCVTSEVHKGAIRGQEKAQCSSSRTACR